MMVLLKWSQENQKCINIIYQDDKNQITQRIIRVLAINNSSIRAYCYYRKAQRLFKLDNILSAAKIQNNRRGA